MKIESRKERDKQREEYNKRKAEFKRRGGYVGHLRVALIELIVRDNISKMVDHTIHDNEVIRDLTEQLTIMYTSGFTGYKNMSLDELIELVGVDKFLSISNVIYKKYEEYIQ